MRKQDILNETERHQVLNFTSSHRGDGFDIFESSHAQIRKTSSYCFFLHVDWFWNWLVMNHDCCCRLLLTLNIGTILFVIKIVDFNLLIIKI